MTADACSEAWYPGTMGTATILLTEQRPIPEVTPAGTIPVTIYIMWQDDEDDSGYLGMFLPEALLRPTNTEDQRLICAYIAWAVIELGNEEDRSGNRAQKIIADLAQDTWTSGMVVVRPNGERQDQTRFAWDWEDYDLGVMAAKAEAHFRAHQLERVANTAAKTPDTGKRKL